MNASTRTSAGEIPNLAQERVVASAPEVDEKGDNETLPAQSHAAFTEVAVSMPPYLTTARFL
jgi:hypothetical protein